MGTRTLPSPALLTDLYQLTMAYGYWKVGLSEHQAVFHLFFRKNPFGGGYAIAAGLDAVIALLNRWRFSEDDLAYLGGLTGNDGEPLFSPEFLTYLGEMRFTCDVDAVEEGTVVFPHEPLVRMKGPLIQCQLLETALLTIVNFQTLIATKASRVCRAAEGEAVLEFGLRRAQGVDGGLSASRAAIIGGCAATSNVLAGKLYDLPVKGTHAHSWVMAFDTEKASFEQYASAMPNNCIFLVDTYDTVEGVKTAVEVGLDLRERGYEMIGVRLDSGDLAALSIAARKILDEGGFPDAAIVASDSLDEHRIRALKEKGAVITVWGVGTRLATAKDQPALGGVYKLAAIQAPGEAWAPRIKLSEIPIKVSNPGIQQIRRYYTPDGTFQADVIVEDGSETAGPVTLVDIEDMAKRQTVSGDCEDLLQPIYRAGLSVYSSPPVSRIREVAQAQLSMLPADVLAFTDAATYPVGLSEALAAQKVTLMAQHKET